MEAVLPPSLMLLVLLKIWGWWRYKKKGVERSSGQVEDGGWMLGWRRNGLPTNQWGAGGPLICLPRFITFFWGFWVCDYWWTCQPPPTQWLRPTNLHRLPGGTYEGSIGKKSKCSLGGKGHLLHTNLLFVFSLDTGCATLGVSDRFWLLAPKGVLYVTPPRDTQSQPSTSGKSGRSIGGNR